MRMPRPGRWVSPGARWGARDDGQALGAAPPSVLGVRVWTEVLGAAGAAPPRPRGPTASPSCARRGEGLSAGGGPRARRGSLRPAPPTPRPLHSLAFPGRGLCSSRCAVPTSSAFTACTSSCSFPMAGPGPQRRGCAPCALRGSEATVAAPRRRPHPPPSSTAFSTARAPRRPPAPARAPGEDGAGSASRAGGGPEAGAGGGREAGARHLAPPPGRLGPSLVAADLRPPAAPAARPAPWLRPYIGPRPP